jgi:hypothetical protein
MFLRCPASCSRAHPPSDLNSIEALHCIHHPTALVEVYEKEPNRSPCWLFMANYRTWLGCSILPFMGVFRDDRSLNSGQLVAWPGRSCNY